MVYVTADQLAELLLTLLVLFLCAGTAVALLGCWFYGFVQGIAQWLDKRSNPPSPAMLKSIAANMRARAVALEIRAEKALQK